MDTLLDSMLQANGFERKVNRWEKTLVDPPNRDRRTIRLYDGCTGAFILKSGNGHWKNISIT